MGPTRGGATPVPSFSATRPELTTRRRGGVRAQPGTGEAPAHREKYRKGERPMTRLLRPLLFAVVIAATLALAAPTWAATTTNPANAPQGTHYKSGTASCSVS